MSAQFSCQQFLPIPCLSHRYSLVQHTKPFTNDPNLPSCFFPHGSHHPLPILLVFFLQLLHPSSYVTVFFLAHPGSFRLWSLKNHFNYTSFPLQLPPIRHLHVFSPWTTRFLIGREYVLSTTESPSPSSVPGT
jgi:hypothetical protein